MSSEWLPQTFGDLVDFVSLKARADEVNPETYVSTENMLPDFGGVQTAASVPLSGGVTKFSIDDVLFSNIRTYFKKVWKAEFSGHCSNDVLVFRSKDYKVLLQGYLHNLCRWDKFIEFSVRTSKGAKMPRGDKDALVQFQFELPPIEIQHAIVEILNSLDDRIRLLRETNQTLEAIAQALFKSWFVDFEPVRAKAEGRLSEGVDDATVGLFPDAFIESELGLLPSGWEVKPIGEVVETLGGGTPDTKNPAFWEPPKHNWTTPKDLSNLAAPVLLQTERKLSDAGLCKVSSGLLPAGTLLMSSRAPIGYLAISHAPIAINQGYIAIPPNGKLSPLFMLFWCKANMEIIKARANGSTFMEISKKAFKPILVIVPSSAVLESFDAIAAAVFSRVVSNAEQIQYLTNLRDTLLPRLISGQLRIADAQTELEKAIA